MKASAACDRRAQVRRLRNVNCNQGSKYWACRGKLEAMRDEVVVM